MNISIPTYNIFRLNSLKITVVIVFLFFFNSLYAQTNIYVLKAVYLEKFSRFVTWPEEYEMSNTEKPFIIGVIGKTPMYKNLTQIYSAKKINNKSVKILKVEHYYQIKDCHILVISESERKNIKDIISYSEDKGVLTISDSPKFSQHGVLINFFEENNKLRFEINETAVLKSPIQMSFYLMNSAQIVNPVKDN